MPDEVAKEPVTSWGLIAVGLRNFFSASPELRVVLLMAALIGWMTWQNAEKDKRMESRTDETALQLRRDRETADALAHQRLIEVNKQTIESHQAMRRQDRDESKSHMKEAMNVLDRHSTSLDKQTTELGALRAEIARLHGKMTMEP